MRRGKSFSCVAVLLGASILGACGVPHYDVPYTNVGHPTVNTIIERIQCEIRDLVRTDIGDPSSPSRIYGSFLRSNDFDVLIALSIDVTETGGLTPSLSYMYPPSLFTFSANATLSESRDHTFTENLQYPVRQIYLDWYSADLAQKAGLDPRSLGLTLHDCPSEADTNLSGELGIVDFVALASRSAGLDTKGSASKLFGGTIQFLVTKNVNAVGPTWSLVHFKGPGGLGGLSQVNTDKIVLSFAEGSGAGSDIVLPTLAQLKRDFLRPEADRHPTRSFNAKAYLLLQQQLTGSIGSQLNNLQNGLVNGSH